MSKIFFIKVKFRRPAAAKGGGVFWLFLGEGGGGQKEIPSGGVKTALRPPVHTYALDIILTSAKTTLDINLTSAESKNIGPYSDFELFGYKSDFVLDIKV